MYIVLVSIQMKPERREAFLDAMLENARRSLADESGCVRFDVVEDEADPNHLILYEIYRDRAASTPTSRRRTSCAGATPRATGTPSHRNRGRAPTASPPATRSPDVA
jgi:Antibiotic biosynthesis monooxygenase